VIENLVDFAVVAPFGVTTALACNRLLSAPKMKPDNRQRGYRDEEIEDRPGRSARVQTHLARREEGRHSGVAAQVGRGSVVIPP
jgi:hypothetical protein